MIDNESLAGNLKRALREADDRFRRVRDRVVTHAVPVHELAIVSINPFDTRHTVRTARAVLLRDDHADLVYLVDDVKIGVMCVDDSYTAMQADSFVNRLSTYCEGNIDAALKELEEIFQATRQLFR